MTASDDLPASSRPVSSSRYLNHAGFREWCAKEMLRKNGADLPPPAGAFEMSEILAELRDIDCVEALITTSQLTASVPDWTAGLPDARTPGFADCFRLPSAGPNGLVVAIMDEVDLRLDPACLGFAAGAPSGSGELRGWLALHDDEPFDAHSLLYAVDAFPPATFEVELSGWVPTLELTVYVRALPAPGPVRVLQRAQAIDAGRVDEACYVWDCTGRLVAQGTQLAGIRLG